MPPRRAPLTVHGKVSKRKVGHAVDPSTVVKDDLQEYGVVEKTMGNGRFSVQCYDGKLRQAHLRGKFTKGKQKHDNFITPGDHVLVSMREGITDKDKCDIIIKYTGQQVRELLKRKELPTGAIIKQIEEDDDMPFDFEDI